MTLKVQTERELQGRTRADVARAAAINGTTYGWIEAQRFIPLDSQLVKIAKALRWPLDRRYELLAEVTDDARR